MASPASSRAPAASSSRSLNLVDLPQEVQAEIIRHCSRSDLICVALVSRHFRDLAAAELYRDFHIVFPDEDNPQFDTPVDSLAGGFDTFVTSDYNYAQYLRALCFDTLYMGDKAEVTYRPYLANLSCGKFMNTLLLLTLRKASALESFKWNIRVELSRSVYKELRQLTSLAHVHIRLQAGPSQYETPPPLPYNASQSTTPPGPAHITPLTSLPPPPTFGFMPPPPPGAFYIPASTVPLPPLPKPPRARAPKKAPVDAEPPTLSVFKKLKTLAVLDIDTLDIVPELQACLRNSAGTLTELELSFSEKLAATARKPSVDPEPEDSDQDDEMVPLPVAQNDEMSAPARVFRAQEERKTQESVLARIFDVESVATEKTPATTVEVEKKGPKAKVRSEEELVNCMKTIAAKFMGELNGTNGVAASSEVVEMIAAAAKKYIEDAKSEQGKQDADPKDSEVSPSDANTPPGSTDGDAAAEASSEANGPAVSLFSETPTPTRAKEDQGDSNPDDIDIVDPEEQLAIDPEEPPADTSAPDTPAPGTSTPPQESVPEPASTSTPPAAPTTTTTKTDPDKPAPLSTSPPPDYTLLASDLTTFESQARTLAAAITHWRATAPPTAVGDLGSAAAERQLHSVARTVSDMRDEVERRRAAAKSKDTEDMREYLRATRGVALTALSVYLVPVKASVLSRAVDVRALRRLTLLNVGVQAPVWALLQRENKEAPLPLREVFSDNVSAVLLGFLGELKGLEECFLLEREVKAKPESFAPKTQTGIEQIRRLVLKRHLGTLRRVMVKNLADTSWDFDDKTVGLVCRMGRRLEELACNMSIRAMHCLMQRLSGLASLRALHVVHLRNDDTCVWVMRETKRFLVDNLVHYPSLPLEWIAIDEDDRVDQIVRVPPSKPSKEGGKGKDKGKGKETETEGGDGPTDLATPGMITAAYDAAVEEGGVPSGVVDVQGLIAAGVGWAPEAAEPWDGGEEEGEEGEDDEEEEEDGAGVWGGGKIETVEAVFFCDVEGVRIFRKEVVAGRL